MKLTGKKISESKKEAKELISEADMELSDDDLDNVSGGFGSDFDSFDESDPDVCFVQAK